MSVLKLSSPYLMVNLYAVCRKSGYYTAETVYKAPPGFGLPNMGSGAGGGSIGLGVGMTFPLNVGGKSNVYPSRITVEMEPL
ncbi:MAG: hypothetical protein H7240_07400 [Glaciimonas sp.]|nr:hypothetical protein [Glaciimonas sp.]